MNAFEELTDDNQCVSYRHKYVTSGVQHLKQYTVIEELRVIEKICSYFRKRKIYLSPKGTPMEKKLCRND